MVVGGDQFQVAAPDPVAVIHALVAGLRAGRGGGVHGHIQLCTHGGNQAGGRKTGHVRASEVVLVQNPESEAFCGFCFLNIYYYFLFQVGRTHFF